VARTTQRDVMRELNRRYGGDPGQVVAAYAAAERRGDVKRDSNVRGMTPEEYAERLYHDGVSKGWMAGDSPRGRPSNDRGRPSEAGKAETREPTVGALDVCNVIAQWAEVAGVTTAAGSGAIAVARSDLLKRLIYGGESGPSRTPCPVHNGVWSGLHSGWPGEPDPKPELQAWWDAGCRCATHTGSGMTTGWNPDRNCCAR
jgi:hypothetical protein